MTRLTAEDRRLLLEFREQAEMALESTRRQIEALRRTGVDDDNPTPYLQSLKALVPHLEESLVFTDYALSE